MKRISILAAALIGAALFFGCSNDSDSPVIPTGPALPASVGTNPFAGKTLTRSYTVMGTTYETKSVFTANTVTSTQTTTYADSTSASAYKKIKVTQHGYSYNNTTKSLYTNYIAAPVTYIERGSSKTVYADQGAFTTDAQYLESYKTYQKQIYDKLSDEQLTAQAKASRYWKFMAYGYTDQTGDTAVSNEIIAKYNKVQAATIRWNGINIQAYEISGTTAKLRSDSRFPAGLGLEGIYGTYVFSGSLYNGATPTYSLRYSTNVYSEPALVKADGTEAYKVAAVTANALVISEKSARESATVPLYMSYVAAPETCTYTTSKTDTTATFDFGSLGKATITYATSTNVPSMATADTYTLN